MTPPFCFLESRIGKLARSFIHSIHGCAPAIARPCCPLSAWVDLISDHRGPPTSAPGRVINDNKDEVRLRND